MGKKAFLFIKTIEWFIIVKYYTINKHIIFRAKI